MEREKTWAYVIVSDIDALRIYRRLRRHVTSIRRTPLPGTIFVASTLTSTELMAILKPASAAHFLILDAATDRCGMLPAKLWTWLSAFDDRECPKCAALERV